MKTLLALLLLAASAHAGIIPYPGAGVISINISTGNASTPPGISTGAATNATLSGNGNSGSPLSAQPLANAVATATTTLQTNINGKQDSFVGISSSCAAGFYLSSATWVNGIQTIGGCVAVSTALPPSGSAGGDLTGTYPNPTLNATQGNVRTFTSSITFSTNNLDQITLNSANSNGASMNFSEGGTVENQFGHFSSIDALEITTGTETNSSQVIFHADHNGNIGLGTVTPLSTLDVNGAATVRGQETVTSSMTVQGSSFSVGGSTFVVTGGNVGIGTASPGSALDVNGNINTNAALALSNSDNTMQVSMYFGTSSSNQTCSVTCGSGPLCVGGWSAVGLSLGCSSAGTNNRCLCANWEK